ncbi:Fasciclin domain-containing protein [Hyaloraphidium curvatum]|nr:Fasciclin domain-containing protein [Hyaloraphidium curvatum]
MRLAVLVAALALAAPSIAAPLDHEGEFRAVPVASKNILGVLEDDPQFGLIAHVVKEDRDFAALLEGHGPLTFFAPNDDALRRVTPPHRPGEHPPTPPKEVLHEVLLYHTVGEAKKAGDLGRGDLLDSELALDSLKGAKQKLRICAWQRKEEDEKHVLVNCVAPVRRADIEASNGVVHEIGGVLIPPGPVTRHLSRLPRVFGLFILAARKAELSGTLDNSKAITVFAPTNRAFAKLGWKTLRFLLSPPGYATLRKVLSYHVSADLAYSPVVFEHGHADLKTLEGGVLKLKVEKKQWHDKEFDAIVINEASTVIFPDVPVANGAVHVLSDVLISARRWRRRAGACTGCGGRWSR